MLWLDKLNGDLLPWLLEQNHLNPATRYYTLYDLLERPINDPEVLAARSLVMTTGPVHGGRSAPIQHCIRR